MRTGVSVAPGAGTKPHLKAWPGAELLDWAGGRGACLSHGMWGGEGEGQGVVSSHRSLPCAVSHPTPLQPPLAPGSAESEATASRRPCSMCVLLFLPWVTLFWNQCCCWKLLWVQETLDGEMAPLFPTIVSHLVPGIFESGWPESQGRGLICLFRKRQCQTPSC